MVDLPNQGLFSRVFRVSLNLPWSLTLIFFGMLSKPSDIKISKYLPAVIILESSFWWYIWIPGKWNVRAMALGNVVLIGLNAIKTDQSHELIHIKQHMFEPFVHPFLNLYQNIKYGYKNNKYELLAYKNQ